MSDEPGGGNAPGRTYTCAQCDGEFVSNWSDEEAMDEARENGFEPDRQAMAIICDDCYRLMMAERAMAPLRGLLHPPGRST